MMKTFKKVKDEKLNQERQKSYKRL